jgi:DNA-binding MarR family transcriptional regulator
MVAMEAIDLDLPTLVALAGPGTVQLLLQRIANSGHAGVQASHGYVFQRLVDDEPTIGALADGLGMTQQGASKHVRDLERLGYVERVTRPNDQRIRSVRLTPSGRSVLEAGRQARLDLEAEVANRVGAQSVTAAKTVLVAILQIAGLDQNVRTRTMPLPQDD